MDEEVAGTQRAAHDAAPTPAPDAEVPNAAPSDPKAAFAAIVGSLQELAAASAESDPDAAEAAAEAAAILAEYLEDGAEEMDEAEMAAAMSRAGRALRIAQAKKRAVKKTSTPLERAMKYYEKAGAILKAWKAKADEATAQAKALAAAGRKSLSDTVTPAAGAGTTPTPAPATPAPAPAVAAAASAATCRGCGQKVEPKTPRCAHCKTLVDPTAARVRHAVDKEAAKTLCTLVESAASATYLSGDAEEDTSIDDKVKLSTARSNLWDASSVLYKLHTAEDELADPLAAVTEKVNAAIETLRSKAPETATKLQEALAALSGTSVEVPAEPAAEEGEEVAVAAAASAGVRLVHSADGEVAEFRQECRITNAKELTDANGKPYIEFEMDVAVPGPTDHSDPLYYSDDTLEGAVPVLGAGAIVNRRHHSDDELKAHPDGLDELVVGAIYRSDDAEPARRPWYDRKAHTLKCKGAVCDPPFVAKVRNFIAAGLGHVYRPSMDITGRVLRKVQCERAGKTVEATEIGPITSMRFVDFVKVPAIPRAAVRFAAAASAAPQKGEGSNTMDEEQKKAAEAAAKKAADVARFNDNAWISGRVLELRHSGAIANDETALRVAQAVTNWRKDQKGEQATEAMERQIQSVIPTLAVESKPAPSQATSEAREDIARRAWEGFFNPRSKGGGYATPEEGFRHSTGYYGPITTDMWKAVMGCVGEYSLEYNRLSNRFDASARRLENYVDDDTKRVEHACGQLKEKSDSPADRIANAKEFHLLPTELSDRFRHSPTLASFPQILASVLMKEALIGSKGEESTDPSLWQEDDVISKRTDVPRTDTIHRTRVYDLDIPSGTLGDGQSYGEATTPTDEEETFSVVKAGFRLLLPIEVLANDDTGTFQRVPEMLRRAGRRWIRRRVTNPFRLNQALTVDNLGIFHASHNNVVAGLYSYGNGKTILQYVRQQLRPSMGSTGDREHANISPVTAWMSDSLWNTVKEDFVDTKPDTTNRAGNAFMGLGLKLRRVPEWDAYGATGIFMIMGDPAENDMMEAVFHQGRRDAEVFAATSEEARRMWESDQQEFKLRVWQERAPLDHRPFAAIYL